MDDDFIVRLELDVRDAKASANSLIDVLARLNAQFDNKNLQAAERNLAKYATAEDKAAASAKRHAQSLSTTRYALYDVSTTLATAGIAMLGLATATYGVAIAFERDFANVIRTSQVTGDAIGTLRDDFVDLAQTIPVAFSELAEIGTLGGQLGVAAGDLSNFTSVVARFSATTNLSADAAATAFGRLSALLPDVQGNYEALASSILKVGVNSVATESSIANIAVQISSMGNFAGLTADEVIGLSGALASVGAAPELSRGTVTRLFTQISKAVATSGDDLDNFAKVAGVSSNEFASAFGTDKFGPIFLKFVNGLNDIDKQGGNTVATLNELGITSVRDVPLLLRLATASDTAGKAGNLLNQTLADASSGYNDASTLAEQYGVIAGTVSAKLQLLANNFQVLLAAIGQGGGVIGGAIDGLNDLLKVLTDLSKNPVGNFFLQAGLLLTGFLGVAALIGAVAARGYAGLIALTQATVGLSAASGGATVSLASMTATMAATGGAGRVAATGVNLLSKALRILALIGLVEISFEGFKVANSAVLDLTDNIQGFDHSIDETAKRLAGQFAPALESATDNDFLGWLNDVYRGFADIGVGGSAVTRDIKRLDEAVAALFDAGNVSSGNALLKQVADGANISVDQLLERLPSARDAYAKLGDEAVASAVEVDAATAAQDAAALAAENLATSLGLVPEELEALQSALKDGSSDFFSFADAIDVAYGEGGAGIQQFIGILDEQLAAQSVWADNLAILTARGATGFVTELAKLGPAGAQVAADAVNLTSDELFKLEDQARLAAFLSSAAFAQTFTENQPLLIAAYSAGGIEAVQAMIVALRTGDAQIGQVMAQYGIVTAQNPIPIYANTNPAQSALNTFFYNNSGKSLTVGLGVLKSNGNNYNFASGGRVNGPGTGTSDSIPARLSNGEYVIRAASVRKYGAGMFEQLNRGVAKFASGGPVGFAGGGLVSGSSGFTEFGSWERRALMQLVRNTAQQPTVGIAPIAQGVNAYNANSSTRRSA